VNKRVTTRAPVALLGRPPARPRYGGRRLTSLRLVDRITGSSCRSVGRTAGAACYRRASYTGQHLYTGTLPPPPPCLASSSSLSDRRASGLSLNRGRAAPLRGHATRQEGVCPASCLCECVRARACVSSCCINCRTFHSGVRPCTNKLYSAQSENSANGARPARRHSPQQPASTRLRRERKCADTIGTVLVPWAG